MGTRMFVASRSPYSSAYVCRTSRDICSRQSIARSAAGNARTCLRTFDIEVSINFEDGLAKAEGVLEILRRLVLENTVVVEQLGPKLVNQSVEGEPVLPAAREVLDLDARVPENGEGQRSASERCRSNPLVCC